MCSICEKEKCSTRVIIRGLPPDITEDILLEKLQPRPEFNHFYLVNIKIEDGITKLPHAYMNFDTHEELVEFIQNFDYKVLKGNNGMRYKIMLEIAPNQKFKFNKRNKVDPKINTIEQDKYYQFFLDNLDTKETFQNSYINYDFYLKKNENQNVTPLLRYVLERKMRKEGKLDGMVFVNSNKRKTKQRLRRDF